MLSSNVKYIGLDVHKEATTVAVRNAAGKLVMESIVETKARTLIDLLDGLRGELHVTLEEGTWAAWLYDVLKPHVRNIVVCNPRRNALLKESSKDDRVDARKLSELLRAGTAARRNAARGLPRRKWVADVAGVGAQLSGGQQGLDAGDEPDQGSLSQLGHSLHRHASLYPAPSRAVAE
jgi:hypothetical protein